MSRVKNTQSAKNRAFLAFGGNLDSTFGSPLETIGSSLEVLARIGSEITGVSGYFSTPCFPKGAGPDYVNCVAEVQTSLAATAFLECLHEIELQFERTRETRWAGRTLDIDLLSFENAILPGRETYLHWVDLPLDAQMQDAPSELILPHPRIQDRGFVLIPLCDLKPDWLHPVLGKTARELCDALPEDQIAGVQAL